MSKIKDVVIDHMNSRAAQVVKAIGNKVIDELYDFDDYKIEYDEGYLYSASISVHFGFEFGNGYCDVDVYASWSSRKSGEVKLELCGTESVSTSNIKDCKERVYKKLDRINDAVLAYVDENLDMEELLGAIEDKYKDDSADEWESHGFRDAADYYHYRYGR